LASESESLTAEKGARTCVLRHSQNGMLAHSIRRQPLHGDDGVNGCNVHNRSPLSLSLSLALIQISTPQIRESRKRILGLHLCNLGLDAVESAANVGVVESLEFLQRKS